MRPVGEFQAFVSHVDSALAVMDRSAKDVARVATEQVDRHDLLTLLAMDADQATRLLGDARENVRPVQASAAVRRSLDHLQTVRHQAVVALARLDGDGSVTPEAAEAIERLRRSLEGARGWTEEARVLGESPLTDDTVLSVEGTVRARVRVEEAQLERLRDLASGSSHAKRTIVDGMDETGVDLDAMRAKPGKVGYSGNWPRASGYHLNEASVLTNAPFARIELAGHETMLYGRSLHHTGGATQPQALEMLGEFARWERSHAVLVEARGSRYIGELRVTGTRGREADADEVVAAIAGDPAAVRHVGDGGTVVAIARPDGTVVRLPSRGPGGSDTPPAASGGPFFPHSPGSPPPLIR